MSPPSGYTPLLQFWHFNKGVITPHPLKGCESPCYFTLIQTLDKESMIQGYKPFSSQVVPTLSFLGPGPCTNVIQSLHWRNEILICQRNLSLRKHPFPAKSEEKRMFSQAKEILKHRGQGYFVFHGHRLHAPMNHSSSMLLSHKTQIIVFTYTCC